MILAGRAVKLGMGATPGQCDTCKNVNCLQNSRGYYHRIINAPRDSVLAGRVLYITKERIPFIVAEIQSVLEKRPAFEVLEVWTGICPWQIKDDIAEALLERYHYCKEFNFPPFPSYDETPAGWRQAALVISTEVARCLKAWEKDIARQKK